MLDRLENIERRLRDLDGCLRLRISQGAEKSLRKKREREDVLRLRRGKKELP